MTKISKTLVIAIVAACIAFASFVAVTFVGGPSWEVETRAEDLKDYVISRSEPAEDDEDGTVTFSATDRKTGEAVGTASPIIAKVISDVRKHLKSNQQTKQQKLDQEIPVEGGP
jgi:hypothetical protein